MEHDARVTTTVVGLLIAFCALLLFKWLALVGLAALVLVGVLRLMLRRVLRARRAAREAVAPAAPGPGPVPATADGAAVVVAMGPAPDCSWCGLLGGHRDLRGRPVRPRHAHALPAPSRRAS